MHSPLPVSIVTVRVIQCHTPLRSVSLLHSRRYPAAEDTDAAVCPFVMAVVCNWSASDRTSRRLRWTLMDIAMESYYYFILIGQLHHSFSYCLLCLLRRQRTSRSGRSENPGGTGLDCRVGRYGMTAMIHEHRPPTEFPVPAKSIDQFGDDHRPKNVNSSSRSVA